MLFSDEDENECQKKTRNCDVNAQCNNTTGSFNCTCLQGYLGNGVQCSGERPHYVIILFEFACVLGLRYNGTFCSDL